MLSVNRILDFKLFWGRDVDRYIDIYMGFYYWGFRFLYNTFFICFYKLVLLIEDVGEGDGACGRIGCR